MVPPVPVPLVPPVPPGVPVVPGVLPGLPVLPGMSVPPGLPVLPGLPGLPVLPGLPEPACAITTPDCPPLSDPTGAGDVAIENANNNALTIGSSWIKAAVSRKERKRDRFPSQLGRSERGRCEAGAPVAGFDRVVIIW
jgi:hypothetical protein